MRKIDTILKALGCIILLLTTGFLKSNATYITVAKDGSGQYNTVQAAVNAAPVATSANPDTIYIKDGRYKEKINIPATKPYIVMIGQSVANTILTYDDGASTIVGGVALGTQNSASVTINDSNFTALNITFANSFGDGSQAVAILVNSDKVAFKNCRFLGNQDTMYLKGNGTPHHYFSNCYVDGNVDFVFGSAAVVFDTCVIYGKVKPSTSSTYITAPNTPVGQTYGIVYRGCQITGNTGTGYYYLGRPWQAAPNAVYLDSKVYNNMIIPAGWSSNSAGSATLNDAYFAEHKSRLGNGTLVDTTFRVSQSHQISDAVAATYTLANIMGSWNPCAIFSCGGFSPTIAMANMKAIKGTTYDTLRWNISWPIAGVQYQLYRSSDSISYTALASQIITAPNDTTWNFQFIDTVPSQGNIYWYYVKATKTGYATNNSDTVKISSAPTIIASGTINAFTQYLGAPSAPQTYTVSGTNLTANVSITAPTNYEISTNGGGTYAGTASLTPSSGTLAATTIYLRLNATALGSYTGNVAHTSTGATTLNIPVSGNTIAAPIFTNDTLELWTLVVNNADSAAVRSPAVVATTPTLSRLYNSTAVSVTTVPAYSPTYGNAFGASSTVDGAWGTANGGPGGNLTRTYYQQFTIKGATNDSLRVDSLIVSSAFYATSSSTKLAVVYSRSGFVSDSTDVSGGSGPTGTLASSANGGFNTPILLAQQNTGPTNTYRLALNGPLGVKTDTAGTLTIRLYFSCSSSSSGRYGMIKNVLAVGDYMPFVACAPPTVTTTKTNLSCTASGNIGLTTTGGTGPFSYSWTGPNGFTSTAQNVSNLVAGVYSVTVTANGGCSTTRNDTIAAPVFNPSVIALGSTSLCPGDTLRLKVDSIGTGYTYTWKDSGNVIPGAVDTLYKASITGSYTVTVTNGGCTSTSTPLIVTVHPLPLATVTSGGPLTFCQGDSVKLTAATAAGNTYAWKAGTSAITGATDSAYVAHNSGSYRVIVTNAFGCKDSSAAQVVTAQPLPSPIVSYAGGDLSTGTYTSYQWYLNGQPIPGATGATYTPAANGDYSVKVDSGSCANISSNFTVTGLGVAAVTLNGQPVIVFPNPAHNIVYVKASGEVNIQVKDLGGRTVATAPHSAQVDISHLSDGIYLLTLSTADGRTILNQRLVKTGAQ